MWLGIEGHDSIVERFRRALARGRLASTFLFVGPEGIGKRTFAAQLAQALLCSARPAAALDPCGRCLDCLQVLAGSHPDLEVVAKPEGKAEIPVAAFIGDPEHRLREGLCRWIALKPFQGGRKIAIVDDADYLNEEGANCLLKTLEEPPPQSLLVLVGTSADRQLPTIRSRTQIVRFAPLAQDVVARLVRTTGLASDEAAAARLARFSEGSLARSAELTDPSLWDYRAKLLALLAAPRLDGVAAARDAAEFVEAAGKEAPPRRARARLAVSFAAEFFRQLTRALSGAPVAGDPDLAAAVAQAQRAGALDCDTAAACTERTLLAASHIERNAHLPTLIDAWWDELGQLIGRGIAA